MVSMFIGIIDIGANSVRLSIYTYENGMIKLILYKKSTIGLIGYVDSGKLTPKGIQKVCSVLIHFNEIHDNLRIDQTYAYASAALRNITNIKEVLEQFEETAGLNVNLLSGETEARLGFYGAAQAAVMKTGLFAVVGGGSTGLVTFENGEILKALSVPLGSLNLSLKYVKGITTHKTNIIYMKQELKRELKRTQLFNYGEQLDIFVTGGTAQAARKLYNDIYDLSFDNNVMQADKLSNMLTKYNEERRDIIQRIKLLTPDRIHTIIPGIVALQTIADMSGSRVILVSNYGVREGYLLKNVLECEDSIV
jgi:exopolyphosphatase / guanosine-5'-triphosphate,3'-diphosphate pyrophosphatase